MTVLKGNIGDSTTHLSANLETTAAVIPVQPAVQTTRGVLQEDKTTQKFLPRNWEWSCFFPQ